MRVSPFDLPVCSGSLVCAPPPIRRANILCVPGRAAMIFLLLFASLVCACRSRLSLHYEGVNLTVAQRNAGYEKAVPAKCGTAFSKLLNRDAGDLEDPPIDAAELTGYRCRDAHRSTGHLPVINGSGFPNDDAPAPCGTRGDDDTALRRPGR